MKLPLLAAALVALVTSLSPVAAASPDALQQGFIAPPADTRPTVRWWWFGPAVVKPQLQREITLMRDGGFGGFEVQPTYPLALDGQYPGLKNIKFLSPAFFDLLGFTSATAKSLGLRMDLTLGSGWPYGGPMFSRQEAAQSIAEGGRVAVTPGQTTVTAPVPTGRGASADAPVIAALLGPVQDAAPGASPYLPLALDGRTALLPSDLHGAAEVRFFVSAPAGLMRVKRAAYGDEGFIVDHYSRAAVDKFIREVARPEIAACGENPPYSVFCDSLEVVGEGWTPGFPEFFRQRHGYDLIPFLPALFDANFPHAADIRGDYGEAIAALFDRAFVEPFETLARETHTQFRLQAYGTPPTTLSTYAHVDIDEGENFNWRVLSGTRWAASASHLLGRAVTSSEAFTWLHSPVFLAAPVDLKAESNLQFLNGVNHLLYHGWPYTAPGVEYPGWRFYAAGVFNEKNPWWIVMPDINRYLSRTSFLLRTGTPANDVAIYLPEEDAFAAMTPSDLQMVQAGGNGILNRLVNPLIPAILDAGYNFDGVDAGVLASHGRIAGSTLAFGDVAYRIVILPPMTRIAPASLRTLEAFVDAGGILISVGTPPTAAPGYRPSDADRQSVREISARLFTGPGAKATVTTLDQLPTVLQKKLAPDVAITQLHPALGFVHRRVPGTDFYFVANTTNQSVSTSGVFRIAGRGASWWDATTGQISPADVTASSDQNTSVAIELAPYEARFLVFAGSPRHTEAARTTSQPPIDLSRDWSVTFQNASPEPNPVAVQLPTLTSWTQLPATKYFAGVATYTKRFDVTPDILASGLEQYLDFGAGDGEKVAGGTLGMHADFQPPVADAAVVYLNGERLGALWSPPYRLNVTGRLHAGANELRVEVANRAINYLADTAHHPLPDYHALNANRELGGDRFQPQDMDAITTTPSGLLGPIQLQLVRR